MITRLRTKKNKPLGAGSLSISAERSYTRSADLTVADFGEVGLS